MGLLPSTDAGIFSKLAHFPLLFNVRLVSNAIARKPLICRLFLSDTTIHQSMPVIPPTPLIIKEQLSHALLQYESITSLAVFAQQNIHQAMV